MNYLTEFNLALKPLFSKILNEKEKNKPTLLTIDIIY